ncbi:MAG: GtrA family protein [Epsilonproteobacteria bacterium]|nr:GtrA family protein [Campylobacterota bacterium]
MFGEFVRYNLVGIVNTLVGFSIVFGLMFMGMEPIPSNMIGYAIGSVVSFYLNSKYTFKATENSLAQAGKFFMVLALSYLLNYITLQWLLAFINPYMAQLFSAIVYTLSSFVLAKFLVFKES